MYPDQVLKYNRTSIQIRYCKVLRSAIADPVNCIILIIRDQQSSIRHYKDIHRSSPGCKPLEPSFCTRLVTDRPSVLKPDKSNSVSDWDFPVPGAMFGDKALMHVLFRQHSAR